MIFFIASNFFDFFWNALNNKTIKACHVINIYIQDFYLSTLTAYSPLFTVSGQLFHK